MIDYGAITAAIKTLLVDNLGDDYTITRNEPRNVDPNRPLEKPKGLINITRGPMGMAAHTTGARPWLATIQPIIEIQVSSMLSGEDAEDKLQDAQVDVMTIIGANLKLGNTVEMTNNFGFNYQYKDDDQIYFHSVQITLTCQSRDGV